MELPEYIKSVVVGAIGGLVATLAMEVKGMNMFSLGYIVAVIIILLIISFVILAGWSIIKIIDPKNKFKKKNLRWKKAIK